MKPGKVIVIAAPSGCGKSTIIKAILQRGGLDIAFAVSATTRAPREGEKHGESYFFITEEEFRKGIAADAFVEYEEVYPGRFYGTPKAEIERITSEGHNVLLDIDVNGALRVKKMFGSQAITIFIEPPTIAELRRRLEDRGTETPESLAKRVERAEYEISKAREFDVTILNDNLTEAVDKTYSTIENFTKC